MSPWVVKGGLPLPVSGRPPLDGDGRMGSRARPGAAVPTGWPCRRAHGNAALRGEVEGRLPSPPGRWRNRRLARKLGIRHRVGKVEAPLRRRLAGRGRGAPSGWRRHHIGADPAEGGWQRGTHQHRSPKRSGSPLAAQCSSEVYWIHGTGSWRAPHVRREKENRKGKRCRQVRR
jgi:hypothetical protein